MSYENRDDFVKGRLKTLQRGSSQYVTFIMHEMEDQKISDKYRMELGIELEKCVEKSEYKDKKYSLLSRAYSNASDNVQNRASAEWFRNKSLRFRKKGESKTLDIGILERRIQMASAIVLLVTGFTFLSAKITGFSFINLEYNQNINFSIGMILVLIGMILVFNIIKQSK